MDSAKKVLPWVVALAIFIEGLDSTIINTALPQIALSMHQDPIHLKLALTSYLLSLGVFIPIGGWLADRFGNRRIFILAIVIFTLSSMGCGLSHYLYELVIMRIIQGMGGAMMVPVGRLILLRLFGKKDLVKALSQVVMFALIGPALGPVLGGFITEYLSWRWVFFVNVPIGIFGVYLVATYLKVNEKREVGDLDVLGFLLLGLGLASFLFAFQLVIDESFPAGYKFILFLLGSLSLGGYVVQSRRCAHPLLSWKVMQEPVFRLTTLGGFAMRLGVGAIPFLLPLAYQLGLGYSPFKAGLMMVPITVAAALMKRFIKPILQAFGYRKTLVLNTFILAAITLQFVWIGVLPMEALMVLLLAYGACVSLQYSLINTLSYAHISLDELTSGTSIAAVFQQVSIGFGIAIAAMVLELLAPMHDIRQHQIPLEDFQITFLLIGMWTFVPALWFRRLSEQAGEESSGHSKATKS